MADPFAGIEIPALASPTDADPFEGIEPLGLPTETVSEDPFSGIEIPESANLLEVPEDMSDPFADIEMPELPEVEPAQPSPALATPQGIKRFDKLAGQPETPSSELGFFKKVGRAFGRGREQVGADIATGRAIAGADGRIPEIVGDPINVIKEGFFDDLTDEDLKRIEPHIQKQISLQNIERDDPVKGENWLATGVYQAANMLGGMWKTLSKSWDDALAGGVIGGGLPGAGLGLTLGSAKEWYFQGLGQMFKEIRAEGIDAESAKNASMAMAVPYAATEFLFTRLPGMRAIFKPLGKVGQKTLDKALKESLGKKLARIAGSVLLKHGVNTLGEISEEGVQQVTNDVARNVAAYLENQKFGTSREAVTAKQMFKNSMDTMIQSALPIALSMAPSVALRGVEAASDYQKLKGAEATTIQGVTDNLIRDFGEENVTQINDKTVGVTLPDGRKIQVGLVAGVEDLAVTDPDAWLESARNATATSEAEVESALAQAAGNKADAIAVLKQLGYGGTGVTQQGVEIKDENGNAVKLDALVQLVEGKATVGTLAHEQWHLIKGLANVTPEQEKELTDKFGDEEAQATAFANFEQTDGVMAKIGDFIRAVLRMLRISNSETDAEVAQRIRQQLVDNINVVKEEAVDNINVVKEEAEVAPAEEAVVEELPAIAEESEVTPATEEATPQTVRVKGGERGERYELIGPAEKLAEDDEAFVELRNLETDEIIFEAESDVVPVSDKPVKKEAKAEPKKQPSILAPREEEIDLSGLDLPEFDKQGNRFEVQKKVDQATTTFRKEMDSTATDMSEASNKFAVTKKVDKKTIRDMNKFQKFFYKFLAFGDAYGRHPETGKKATAIRHRIATAYERASKIVSNALKAVGGVLLPGDYAISYALEEKNGRAKLNERQQKIYDELAKLREYITTEQKKAGVLDKGWLDGTIDTLEKEISELEGKEAKRAVLRESLKSAREMRDTFSSQDEFEKKEQIKILEAEIRQLRSQDEADQAKIDQKKKELDSLNKFEGYVPHKVVARAVLKAMYEQSDPKKRIALSSELARFHKQRQGYATLREYVEGFTNPSTGKFVPGFLTTEDLDPSVLTAQMMGDGLTKIAIKEFIDYGKRAGLVLSEKDARTAGVDWKKAEDFDLNIQGLGDVKLHTLFGNALKELSGGDTVPRTIFDKMLAVTKVGQFFVPAIVWTYDAIQQYMRGIGSFNPITVARTFRQAWKIYFAGGEEYQKLLELGLFQSPGLPTQATADQIIKTDARQLRGDISKSRKFTERLIKSQPRNIKQVMRDIKDNPKTAIPTLVDGVMIPYRAMSTMTWGGDSIIRIQSYLLIKERNPGWSDARAAEYAAKAHGAYSILSTKYQRLASRVLFVHTFRILMPWEVGKSMWSAPKLAYDRMRGKSVDPGEWRLASRAWATTIMTPIAISAAMAANGWEPDEEGLPEWVKKLSAGNPMGIGIPFPTYKNHWKYKKTIKNPEGVEKEIVVGVNSIMNMPVKWISRFTKDRPEKLDDLTYHLFDTVKWEVNPMYRIIFDLVTNESSMGGDRPIRREDSIPKQTFQAGQYAFGNVFRMYGEMLKTGEGTAYKREVKADLEGSLNMLEKVFLGYYTGYTKVGKFNPANVGYVYSRAERRRRLGFAIDALKSAVAKEKGVIKRETKDRPDEMRKRTREMNTIFIERKRRLTAIFLGGKI